MVCLLLRFLLLLEPWPLSRCLLSSLKRRCSPRAGGEFEGVKKKVGVEPKRHVRVSSSRVYVHQSCVRRSASCLAAFFLGIFFALLVCSEDSLGKQSRHLPNGRKTLGPLRPPPFIQTFPSGRGALSFQLSSFFLSTSVLGFFLSEVFLASLLSVLPFTPCPFLLFLSVPAAFYASVRRLSKQFAPDFSLLSSKFTSFPAPPWGCLLRQLPLQMKSRKRDEASLAFLLLLLVGEQNRKTERKRKLLRTK